MNKDSNSKPNIENMYKKKDIKNLIKALAHEDYNIRIKARNALVEIGEPALEPLFQALRDEERGVQYYAASALAIIGDKRVVELLIQASRDENYRVRSGAARALAMMGDKSVLEMLLIQAREDKDYPIRSIVAEALANMGDKRGVEILIQALEDEDPNSRGMATLTLSRLGDKKAVEPLIKILRDDEDSYVRNEAVMALGDIGDKRAVEPLIKTLNDEDTDVRFSVASALGDIGDKRAVEPLIKILRDDEDSYVRNEAAGALVYIIDERAVELIIKSLKDSKYKGVRNDAIETVLSFSIGNKAVELLIQLINDENSDVRNVAKDALIWSSHRLNEKIVKPLIKELEWKDYLNRIRENSRVEFKSSLRWDVKRNCVNKELEKASLKTIAAFLNTKGGTLFIGVSDDCKTYGIENDIKTLRPKNTDGFEQHLIQLIINYIGTIFIQFIGTKFEKREEKTICKVIVDPSPRPVYFKGKRGKEFYIRAGNTTRLLDKKEEAHYIKDHWRRYNRYLIDL